MIEAKDLNDGAILDATTVNKNGRGQVQYKVVLPEGHVLTSDWLPQEESGKYVAKWCQSVRDQFAAQLEEKQAAARMRSSTRSITPQTSADTETTNAPSAKSVSVEGQEVEIEDPEGMVRRILKHEIAKRDLLAAQIGRLLEQREAVDLSVAKWERVAASLGVKLEEENEERASDHSGSSSSAVDSSSTDITVRESGHSDGVRDGVDTPREHQPDPVA